jgi:hypothetical protein
VQATGINEGEENAMSEYTKTDEAVEREVAQVAERIEALRNLARERGLAFSALTDEQLVRKVRGETANSPFIFAQAWTSGTTPGSAATYRASVQNPDPTGYFPVYMTIFFGLGNFFDADQGWIGRDKRWPEFSSDRTFLSANTNQDFVFNYTVPSVPLGTYNGNSVLWQGDFHDVGVSFDRGSFDVSLS